MCGVTNMLQKRPILYMRFGEVIKMKKMSSILLLSFVLGGCMSEENATPVKTEVLTTVDTKTDVAAENKEEAVREVVEQFGSRLQQVSLMGLEEEVAKSMEENYGDLVAAELMEKWLAAPTEAPGRLTSSPWPDRIDIKQIEQQSEHSYVVNGEVVEVTSTEEIASKQSITVIVEKVEGRWLITDVKSGETHQGDTIDYQNEDYGFTFTLPKTWSDYSIVTTEWEGLAIGKEEVMEKGPIVSIRHLEWTEEKPRQDIPVMVLTLEQWNLLEQEKMHIGAAPIAPQELGRNNKYVFALPARYNFAFPTGYEEVENILEGNPLKPIE